MDVYQVNDSRDYATALEATTAVEAAGHGLVVKFVVSHNTLGCLPSLVYNSVALWSYNKGRWTEWSIFTGIASPIGNNSPE